MLFFPGRCTLIRIRAKEVKLLIQEFQLAKISIENLQSARMKPKLLMEHFGLKLGEARGPAHYGAWGLGL